MQTRVKKTVCINSKEQTLGMPSMNIKLYKNKVSEADVIAYKAHVKGGPVEIWLGQVRRVDLPNTLKVDWFDSANLEQIFMMVVLFPFLWVSCVYLQMI